MFLQRLEIHGFKSFAQKSVLEFLAPRHGRKGLTAIVGPNGSGKSNVSDAVRWVLGEQSLKTLRGKKSEDVIFAGSEKRARLGVAEVSLSLNNEDKEAPWEMSEAVITRRLYRDGESEYLINGHTARLQDIAMLLARAHFGQKTYTVIGQGMIDAILAVSPAERKEFFDEAAGVKEFQIKRHQAMGKLKITRENLLQADALVQEIEPRLRSLNRQVKRLNERAEVEKELKDLQKQYYGKFWHELAEKHGNFSEQFHRQDEEFQRKKGEYNQLLNQLNLLEKETSVPQAFLDLEKKYQAILSERGSRQEKKLKLQSQIEIAKIRAAASKTSVPMPLMEIIKELESLEFEQSATFASIFQIKKIEDLSGLRETTDLLREKIKNLLRRLKNPQMQSAAKAIDPELEKELMIIDEEMKNFAMALAKVSQEMQDLNKEEQKKKSKFFEIQRQLQAKQEETHVLEQKLNSIQIELAKLETRKETLEEEINIELGPLGSEVKLKPQSDIAQINPADLQPEIFKLKHQLELIGGIDEEAIAEHKETKERYDFLSTQIADLKRALNDTTTAIEELDNIMRERRDESLKKINDEFAKFFHLLFNGGQAKLVPLYSEAGEEESSDDDVILNEAERGEESLAVVGKKGEPILAGVDIQATPPGKRIKDISILSGGERALTSVALLCAILSHSPSPFVFLDEVDAALDESNSIRFAEIIEQLAEKTQIIVITHNRASMSKAQVLYGVTMGDDGTSHLLSVKLEEAEKLARE
ncbi:MAG: AAA family ATPase [Candidatus Magasanikbacteria bacterium]|nr:AAA family ATPase [Candidatus Magasanikbacteria bacterium]